MVHVLKPARTWTVLTRIALIGGLFNFFFHYYFLFHLFHFFHFFFDGRCMWARCPVPCLSSAASTATLSASACACYRAIVHAAALIALGPTLATVCRR